MRKVFEQHLERIEWAAPQAPVRPTRSSRPRHRRPAPDRDRPARRLRAPDRGSRRSLDARHRRTHRRRGDGRLSPQTTSSPRQRSKKRSCTNERLEPRLLHRSRLGNAFPARWPRPAHGRAARGALRARLPRRGVAARRGLARLGRASRAMRGSVQAERARGSRAASRLAARPRRQGDARRAGRETSCAPCRGSGRSSRGSRRR